jgi:hypothetical protein
MPAATHQRDAVFKELRALVSEFDATHPGGAERRWNPDDALAEILIRINGEIRRARKAQLCVPA